MLARDVSQARADIGQDPSQAGTIAEPERQALRLAHHDESILVAPERNESHAQLESYIDRLGERLRSFRHSLERPQRCLEPLRRRIVRRARNRPLPRPPKIRDCFSPCFGAERVAGEALDVLTRLVGLPAFERFQYRQVQGHPPLVQEARVRNFMCQRVLERVLRLREEAGVIEELGGLEVRERPAEVFLPLFDDCRE